MGMVVPWAALALVVGTWAGFAQPRFPPWPWMLPVLLTAVVLTARWRDGRRLIGIVVLGYALAGLHGDRVMRARLPSFLELKSVAFSGRVTELPSHEARRTRFTVCVDDSPEAALLGHCLRLSWYDPYGATEPGPRREVAAGERWAITAKLRAPRGLRNIGGFDGERQALVDGIVASGFVRSAQQIGPATGLAAWREHMAKRIVAAGRHPSTRFVAALAVGDTTGLSDRDWETLRAVGLTHLIAISGSHVGLVATAAALSMAALWWLLPALSLRWPRQRAMGVGAVVGACLYAIAAGAAVPTVRTAVMITILVAARLLRRQTRTLDAVALSLIAMVLWDPRVVLTAGFWLSFIGVLLLVLCLDGPALPRWREAVQAQWVATLGLLPVGIALFGQASLASPLANAVAIPWWSGVVVPLSLLGLGLESLHTGWGERVWWLATRAFDASWPLFERLSASPFAFAWVPEASWIALPLAMLGAWWLLLPRRVPGKSLALLLVLPLAWPANGRPPRAGVDMVMIDVGQGLSILVRTASHTLLYDMGPAVEGGFDAGERAVLPTLRALGVRSVDRAIASHADNDHAGGLAALRAGLPVAAVFAPQDAPVADARACRGGERWEWDGVRFTFLHPPRDFPYLKNDASCVLLIASPHGRVLLTGDIEDVIERRLVAQWGAALQADVVTVAHHGSRTSSDPAFIRAVGARWALVSSGYANRFRHPASRIVQRWRQAGAKVLDTQEAGAIRVRIDTDGVRVSGVREERARPWDAVQRRTQMAGLFYRSH